MFCRLPVDFAVGAVDLEPDFIVPCAIFGGCEFEDEFDFNFNLDTRGLQISRSRCSDVGF